MLLQSWFIEIREHKYIDLIQHGPKIVYLLDSRNAFANMEVKWHWELSLPLDKQKRPAKLSSKAFRYHGTELTIVSNENGFVFAVTHWIGAPCCAGL
jgi:hypothetical protein